jgi:hypothetical protein
MNDIATITDRRFAASAARDGSDIVVRFTGNAESNAERQLPEFLDAVHGAATAMPGQIARVKVDMTGLAFMNSTCFKDLIVWLERVRDCPEDRQYRIAILSNAAQHWQRRSLHALSCFAKDQVTIESAAPLAS